MEQAVHWFQFSAEVRKRGFTVPLYHTPYIHSMKIDSAWWKTSLSLLLAAIANFPQIRSVRDLVLGGNYDKQLKYILYLSISQGARGNHEKKTCSLLTVMWIINGYSICSNYWFNFHGLFNDTVCNRTYMFSISCLVCYKIGKALVLIAVPKFARGVFKVY